MKKCTEILLQVKRIHINLFMYAYVNFMVFQLLSWYVSKNELWTLWQLMEFKSKVCMSTPLQPQSTKLHNLYLQCLFWMNMAEVMWPFLSNGWQHKTWGIKTCAAALHQCTVECSQQLLDQYFQRTQSLVLSQRTQVEMWCFAFTPLGRYIEALFKGEQKHRVMYQCLTGEDQHKSTQSHLVHTAQAIRIWHKRKHLYTFLFDIISGAK